MSQHSRLGVHVRGRTVKSCIGAVAFHLLRAAVSSVRSEVRKQTDKHGTGETAWEDLRGIEPNLSWSNRLSVPAAFPLHSASRLLGSVFLRQSQERI